MTRRSKGSAPRVLGIDVGATGIKAAVVDLAEGVTVGAPVEMATPRSRKPVAMLDAIAGLVDAIGWTGRVGCGFPAVVQGGIIRTASHIDRAWLGLDLRERLSRRLLLPVVAINDADAAGIAEMRYGAGRGRPGLVVMLTLGTGIGTALFSDGRLVPHLEIGRIRVRGRRAHRLCSNRARKERKMGWRRFAGNLDAFLAELRLMLFPQLVIVGGGISARAEKFLPRLTVALEVVAAAQLNQAGIVGAALAGAESEDAAPALA